MNKSLYAAMVAVQGEMKVVAKDRENPYFKSNYATLKAITDMLRPILAKHSVGYVQSVETRDGSPWMVTTIFHAESGETISSSVPFSAVDSKPQTLGSAITYMKRYGIQCAFGVIVAEDDSDDDGSAANGNKVKPVTKVDTSVCPCGSVKGKKWTDISTEMLETIIAIPASKAPAVTAEHRNAIVAELGRREAAAGECDDGEVVEAEIVEQ